jgi:zinc protease
MVTIIFTGPFQWVRKNNYTIQSMASAFEIKLREVLREELGGTYGVRLNATTSRYPLQEYSINISFGCAPERVDELTRNVFVQIDSLKKFGTTTKYLNKIKETQRREWETDLKENRFWLSALRTVYYHDRKPQSILEYLNFVDNLQLRDIQEAAQKYFDAENYVRVVLMPAADGKSGSN